MSATNYPEFNAAVTELTNKVTGLISDVVAVQTVANIQTALDKAATATTKAAEASTSATNAAASAAATSKTGADTAKTAAETAKTAAPEAKKQQITHLSLTHGMLWAEAEEGCKLR